MSSSNSQSLEQSWPERKNFRRSIRLEFSLYVSALILALMSVTGYVITQQYVATVTEGVVDNLLIQARSYAQAAGKQIIAGERPDVLMLNNICTKLRADNPAVYWVGILARDSSVLAHTDITQLATRGHMLSALSDQYSDQIRPEETLVLESDTIFVRAPIREQGITVGHLQLASSASRISQVRRASILTVATISLLMLAIGIPITMLLTRRKLHPITLITDSLRNIDSQSIDLNPPVYVANEFGYLAETLRVMGRRLNKAQDDLIEKERRDRELDIAREIQSKILPRELPESSCFKFSRFYESANEVGGDYYDVIDLGDGRIAFVVADVSGKSLPGMLVMLMTRDIVRNAVRLTCKPSAVLSAVNRELRPSLKSGMFVTMFYGLLDSNSGRLTFASAGHNPLAVLSGRNAQTQLFKTKGFPLGLMAPDAFDKRLEVRELQLSGGDRVIQYTDGVNEAHNVTQEEFGMDRFLASLQEHAGGPSDSFIDRVMEDHKRFVGQAEQFDDVTILALRWMGTSADKEVMKNGVSVDAI